MVNKDSNILQKVKERQIKEKFLIDWKRATFVYLVNDTLSQQDIKLEVYESNELVKRKEKGKFWNKDNQSVVCLNIIFNKTFSCALWQKLQIMNNNVSVLPDQM